MPVKLPEKPSTVSSTMETPKSPPQTSLIDKIPVKVVLQLAAPYLAGETPESAITLAQKLYDESSYISTIDILGEDMESDADCDASVEDYKRLVDTIAARRLPVDKQRDQITISFKPSMFSTCAPNGSATNPELRRAFDRIESITKYAKEHDINVTLEAEDHRWTDFHLNTYFELIDKGYTNLGTVIQTRLFRTADDIVKFDNRMRVRLVIGIYNEPSNIAHTTKPVMKDLLLSYAKTLFEAGVYVELATHDVPYIHKFFSDVVIPGAISADQFELQFLHGVPREELQKGLVSGSYFTQANFAADGEHLRTLARTGVAVRKYLPFGPGHVAGAYCRRRLKENPNMITYGIKNFFKWQG